MNNPYSIPIDLTIEILSRLPTKSVARFRCVSKLWSSMIDLPYFKELFLTRSSAKPRLLFATAEQGVWSFFSLPQSSSADLTVTAEFHVKFSQDDMRIHPYDHDIQYFSCGYASGLVYFCGTRYRDAPVVCNPNTGGYATLPFLKRYRTAYSFFMFEPIDKQYKVLFMAYPFGPDHHKILTLGTGDMKWRTIKCSLRHDILSDGICINGVFYYLGRTQGFASDAHDVTSDCVIVCFDARSEKFTFIDVEMFCELINYKGKLAVIYLGANKELNLWVLEDVDQQDWSKYAYTLRDDKFYNLSVSFAGVTGSGEIVFSMRQYSSEQPFYVFYFNLERNDIRRVEIKGFGEAFCNVYTFVDHVEDLNVNYPKLLKSFQSTVKRKKFCEYEYSDSD